MMVGSRLVVVASIVLSVTAALSAEVKLKKAADGSLVMYNEGRSKPTRRAPETPLRIDRSDLDRMIVTHANRRYLDPDLVRAVIQVESGYRPMAESHKGAMGLMQLMPATARDLSVSDPWDPGETSRGGTDYLRQLIDQFGGQLELALAGYNAGPQAVERYGGIPPYDETRVYVERVMQLYRGEPGYSLAATPSVRVGRKTYLSRDANGRLIMSTTPPSDR
ncbi:MAG: lytic transglycosylase domain-containing protein [Acidobacteriota bacterium]